MAEDKDDELTPLQAKRKALEEARAAKLAERIAREKAGEDERAIADLEALEAAEAKWGELGKMLGQVHTPIGVVIVRKPKFAEWRRFQDSDKTAQQQDELTYSCVVHPVLPAFRRMVENLLPK
jgi:hypothetical protein